MIQKWHTQHRDACPGQNGQHCEACHGPQAEPQAAAQAEPQAAPPPDVQLQSALAEVGELRALLKKRGETTDAETQTPESWISGGQQQVISPSTRAGKFALEEL